MINSFALLCPYRVDLIRTLFSFVMFVCFVRIHPLSPSIVLFLFAMIIQFHDFFPVHFSFLTKSRIQFRIMLPHNNQSRNLTNASPHPLSFLNNKQDATQITAAPTIIAIHLIKIIYPHIIYFFVSIPHSLYDKYPCHS